MARFGLFTGFANELVKFGECIFAICLLGAEAFGFEDENTVGVDSFSGKPDQPSFKVGGECRGVGDVEAQLHCRGYFIHVLPAGSRGADVFELNFFFQLFHCLNYKRKTPLQMGEGQGSAGLEHQGVDLVDHCVFRSQIGIGEAVEWCIDQVVDLGQGWFLCVEVDQTREQPVVLLGFL